MFGLLFLMLAFSLFSSTGLWGMGFGQAWLALSVFTLWKHRCHYHHRVVLSCKHQLLAGYDQTRRYDKVLY
jgi:hypothetical protein